LDRQFLTNEAEKAAMWIKIAGARLFDIKSYQIDIETNFRMAAPWFVIRREAGTGATTLLSVWNHLRNKKGSMPGDASFF
jgi:hypothetical protein